MRICGRRWNGWRTGDHGQATDAGPLDLGPRGFQPAFPAGAAAVYSLISSADDEGRGRRRGLPLVHPLSLRGSGRQKGNSGSPFGNRGQPVGHPLHGGVGAGKTFYAACIANALADARFSARMVTTPRLLAKLSEAGEAAFALLLECDLLILDDFGAQRQTEYASKRLFSLIDGRYRAGPPDCHHQPHSQKNQQPQGALPYPNLRQAPGDMLPGFCGRCKPPPGGSPGEIRRAPAAFGADD